MKHTYELGKKYGVIKGTRKYLDETGMTGAVGIIIGLGAVLIGLYIIAIVVGSMGTQVTSGNILLSSQWNTTVSSIDTSASSTFNIASILPIAIVGVGIMTKDVMVFQEKDDYAPVELLSAPSRFGDPVSRQPKQGGFISTQQI